MRFDICVTLFSLVFTRGDMVDDSSSTSCTTPNNIVARCVSLYSCPNLLKLLGTLQPAALEFVRQSQCGEFFVCCGPQASFSNNFSLSLPNTQTATVSNNTHNDEPPIWIWTGGLHKIVDTSDMEKHDDKQCGIQYDNEFRWMVLLQNDYFEGKDDVVCTGALISSSYVLTVVECLSGNITTAVLGHQNDFGRVMSCLDNYVSPTCDDIITVTAQETYIHPKYDVTSKLFNSALLHLSENVTFSDYIRPICLSVGNHKLEIPDDKLLLITYGWTTLRKHVQRKVTGALHKVVDAADCQKGNEDVEIIDNSFLCIKLIEEERERESCFSDVGAPIMYFYANRWFMEGLVSNSKNCDSRKLIIGARISELSDWIMDNTRD